VGPTAVGIQLDRKTEVFDGCAYCRKIVLKGGLAAGDDHSIQKRAARLEEGKELIDGDGEAIGRNPAREFRIVAVRTMEVAPGQKQHTTDSTGKIDQRNFLYTAYDHDPPVKGSRKKKFAILGVEVPAWQGAKT
jgi:hypothetical protein